MRRLPLLLCALPLILCAACETRLHPIVIPLDAQTQARVGRLWSELLPNPSEPDRQLVLDTIIIGELHHMGVDRFWFRSEKQFDRGWVVMTSHFDRASATNGEVTVDILDHDRLLLKRLTYPDTEVLQAMVDLRARPLDHVLASGSNDGEPPPSWRQTKASSKEVEARKAKVEALGKRVNPPESQ